jgi:hypothetical protein
MKSASGEGGPLKINTQRFDRNAGAELSVGGTNSGTREGIFSKETAGENSTSHR